MITQASSGILRWIANKIWARRRLITEIINWYHYAYKEQQIGEKSFADKFVQIKQDVAVIDGKLQTIEKTINTIFLIVDRSLGRKVNKSVKRERRH